MHRITLDINVFDVAALYEVALAAYLGSGGGDMEGAVAFLGTPDAPNVASCLVEIWADRAPVEAGYEFVNWEAR